MESPPLMTDDSITFNLDAPIDALTDAEAGYLEGKLLVATPLVMGDVFEQSVIYIFAHNSDGAMGLVINKPVDTIHNTALLKQLDINIHQESDMGVFHGGPVDEHRGFVVHSQDYYSPETLIKKNGICITTSRQILKDVAQGKGPDHKMLVVGYAGWNAGQLQAEIEANSWITVDATPQLVFSDDHETKWALAAGSIGVDMGRFSFATGHA